jgi:hypothetical protein
MPPLQVQRHGADLAEMEQIAASFGAAGLPDGFHRAAAEAYRRLESFRNRATPPSMAEVTQALQLSAVGPASVTPRCKYCWAVPSGTKETDFQFFVPYPGSGGRGSAFTLIFSS